MVGFERVRRCLIVLKLIDYSLSSILVFNVIYDVSSFRIYLINVFCLFEMIRWGPGGPRVQFGVVLDHFDLICIAGFASVM